jgi:hypothetical protein
MNIAINGLEIEITFDRATKEDDNLWLVGTATITNATLSSGRNAITVEVGCWEDSDDDFQVWNSSHEGARIIEAVVTGKSVLHAGECVPSPFIREAADELGSIVCEKLRKAYAANS